MHLDRVACTTEAHKSLTTSEIRGLIDEQFRTDADLRAFLLDVLGLDAYRRFDGIHDRVTLLNQVLICHGELIAQSLHGQRKAQLSPHPTIQTSIFLPRANFSQVSDHAGPSTVGPPGANRHDIRLVALISGAALLIVAWLITHQTTSISSAPQIIIIDSTQIDQARISGLVPNKLDSPEQFARKIQKVGTENVHYKVAPTIDQETKELLRLVVALLRINNKEIARMKYRRPQIQDWNRDSQPHAQFLAQLCNRIESAIEEMNQGACDLGTEARRPMDLGFVDEFSNQAQIQMLPGTGIKKDKSSPEVISTRLLHARTEYEKGNYHKTIEMASSVQKISPQRAWRLIGAAACGVKRISLANTAYRRLDASGKQYLIHMCRSRGIRYFGSQFKIK